MSHQAYTDRCLYDRSILRWHTEFTREGCQSVELIPQGGRLATVRIWWQLQSEERHSLTHILTELLNISQTSVNRILTETWLCKEFCQYGYRIFSQMRK